MEEQQDVFAVLHYHACFDYYYGYMEHLYSVYPSWEKAKESMDSFLAEAEKEGKERYDGVDWEPFITIVQMKWGDTEQKVLFTPFLI